MVSSAFSFSFSFSRAAICRPSCHNVGDDWQTVGIFRMRRAYIGIYWTRPVPWAGLTALSPDVEIAARQSRTIRYQREAVRRYVKEIGGVLAREVALLELAPDRATPESAAELAQVVASAAPEAIFVSVEFSESRGWRPLPFLRDGLPGWHIGPAARADPDRGSFSTRSGISRTGGRWKRRIPPARPRIAPRSSRHWRDCPKAGPPAPSP